jgi:L-threonylcarbamoyladenylate synthase
VTAGTGTVGIRVPGGDVARALAAAAGAPLVATSANLAGAVPPVRADGIAAELRTRLDGVLDGGSTPGGLPSTVAQVEEGRVRVLRAGPIPFDTLERALRDA